jgi:hypothetical protein
MAPSDLASQHKTAMENSFAHLHTVGHKLHKNHATPDLVVKLVASLTSEGMAGAIRGAAGSSKLLVPALVGA